MRHNSRTPDRALSSTFYVPLEALHVAQATTDVIEEHRGALALIVARCLSEEDGVRFPEAMAAELIELLLTLASSMTAVRWESSATLRHAAKEAAFRRAAERAFQHACRMELPSSGTEIVSRAWTDLLRAYLSWLPG